MGRQSKLATKAKLPAPYIIQLPANGSIIIMSCDPASKSYGCTIFEVICKDWAIEDIKILKAYRLKNPIHTPKEDLIGKHSKHYAEIRKLIVKYKPNHIVFERFLSRGRGAAMTAETTNISIGCLMSIAHLKRIPIHCVLAVTWKARTKKMFMYQYVDRKHNKTIRKTPKKNTCLDQLYKNNPKNPHIIDALMIGIYYIDAYAYVNQNHNIHHLLEKLTDGK